MNDLVSRIWGGASAFTARLRGFNGIDFFLVAGLAGLFFELVGVEREWVGVLRPVVEIDLSPFALPQYACFSLARGLLAYALSLSFTLLYGYWAARDRVAERVLVPLLDILQSIPVLGFMPGLVLALVALFPTSNFGLELAAVIMIFTGQAWNMTFGFYQSLKSIPRDQLEASTVYGFNWWQRFRQVELPASTNSLVWNSMMSMAGGWFFLMINEAFVLGNRDFRLPGLGSYMSVAAERGDYAAMAWGVGAMTVMIVALDQFFWRPVVVWAQKFRQEDSGRQEMMSSWFLDLLKRSRVLSDLAGIFRPIREMPASVTMHASDPARRVARYPRYAAVFSRFLFLALVVSFAYGAVRLTHLLRAVPAATWIDALHAGAWTLGRVLAAVAIGTVWALPAGLAIGLTPRLSRVLQPVVQVMASFPAPMLFPAAIMVFHLLGLSLGWGSIALMLLGTQWYILFNVIAGATAIPADLREAARGFHFTRRQRFWNVHVPAVFPNLVTGWVTAAGGAWNASIVAEYVTFRKEVLTTYGLGAQISRAAEGADMPLLAASVVVMSVIVVLFNNAVWRRLYRIAEQRFSMIR